MGLPDAIRFVMVGTTHPGNIGAAARAMKTMGRCQLDLVTPKFFPHPDAVAMSADADDLFTQTRVFDSLQDAVADCGLVIGLTARSRHLSSTTLSVNECVARVHDEAKRLPVALVFGRESSGLSNDELNFCHFHVHIPTNPDFSSLNVASAVQIMAYALYSAQPQHQTSNHWPATSGDTDDTYLPAPQLEVDRLIDHLEKTVRQSGFLNPNNPRRLMYRLRRFFQRARPDQNEINIWRGILTSFEREPHKKIDRK